MNGEIIKLMNYRDTLKKKAVKTIADIAASKT
jgi:hypothetical protein